MSADTQVWDDEEDEDAEESGGVFEPEAGLAVWVMFDKCATCIFHPGNRMHLSDGRVKEMVDKSVANESHIVCHDTLLYGFTSRLRPAVCRGYADHPLGRVHSLALRTGRSLNTTRYQFPQRKEPSVLLAELLATTGLSMRLKRGDVSRHSTGWTSREWRITYTVDGGTLRTAFHLGDTDKEPDLLECLTRTLEVARLVRAAKSYEEWGALHDRDPQAWPSREVYTDQVRHTLRLEDFLGDGMLATYLEAAGADGADQAPVNLDALLPGRKVERPALEGVTWMVPDCGHGAERTCGDGQGLCTWRVLAVHRHRVVVAGYVVETERGYQALVWDKDAREVRHPEQPFRELAVADVCRAYDPSQHAVQSPAVQEG